MTLNIKRPPITGEVLNTSPALVEFPGVFRHARHMNLQALADKRRAMREENEKIFHSHNISLDLPAIRAEWNKPVTETSLLSRASILMRVGQLDLESGTGAFHVELMMQRVGVLLGVRVRPNVMFTSLEATLADKNERMTEIVDLPTASVSTRRIWYMEYFCDWLSESLGKERPYNVAPVARIATHLPELADSEIPTLGQVHTMLDAVEYAKKPYIHIEQGLAAAIACASFTFLLGGGLYDMFAALFGAFAAQAARTYMNRRHYTQYVTTALAVLVAGFVAIGSLRLVSLIDPSALSHDTAYIGAMLFILPTLPFLTGGMDVAKLDYLSAVQRWTHSLVVMTVATMAAWGVAATVDLNPEAFPQSSLPLGLLIALRALASFTGVYFYSLLWNAPARMAFVAACVGAIANTVRLELIDLAGIEPVVAAFVAATLVGLLASVWKAYASKTPSRSFNFPHHALTFTAVAIMVPGFYMYQAMYNLGSMQIDSALDWIFRAAMVAIALPAGLAFSRFLSSRNWRYEI